MDLNNTTIITIIVISVMTALLALFLQARLKRKSYDNENNIATLESIRNSLEKQMYTINDRLIQSEERWRDVNHLLLKNDYSYSNNPISNSNTTFYSDFLKSNGIKENDLLIDKRLIFVLTPFNDKYFEDYKIIRDICTDAGFKCFRGDENYLKGDIFPEMLKLIVKANLIIANVNGRNPNVMYELGIAQALDKPVLLISSEPDKLPIDIKSKRFLIYSNYKDLEQKISNELINISISND
ncbi:hypothetical protein [Elizabethkingia anophelis]|uniref:hypothetical protein n=1 Tax=Elizabethkingia anophelis TaxID=1117645 RepID=UPI00389208F1